MSLLVVETGKLGRATFSACGLYRYLLERPPAEGPEWCVTFCMLNPSTADADQNDQTITKCIKFAGRICDERGGPRHRLGVRIVNLYAFRATDPRDCFAHPKPVGGIENDRAIVDTCRTAQLVICAWGSSAKASGRGSEVRRLLKAAGIELHRFRPRTPTPNPPHPLYLRDDTPIEAW